MPQEEASLIIKVKDQASKGLKGIGNGLKNIKAQAALAAAGFAALIGKSVSMFGEQEAAVNKVEAAIKAQGLEVDSTSKKYQQYASALQEVTKFGDEGTLSALGLGQALAGNVEFTQDAIEAVMDFATATGQDLNGAFNLVGKSIGSNLNALARYGIEIDTSASKSEKLEAITKGLQSRFAGMARSQAEGVGGITQLSNAFGDFIELIGAEFAPFITSAANVLKKFFTEVQKHPIILKMVAAGIALGGALATVVAVLGTIVTIAPVVGTAFTIMMGPVGLITAAIAGLAVAVAALWKSWDENLMGIQNMTFGVFNAIKGLWKSFADNFGSLFSNLGSTIASALTFDMDGIKANFLALKTDLKIIGEDTAESFKSGWKEAEKEPVELDALLAKGEGMIDEAKAKAADVSSAFKEVLGETKAQIDIETSIDDTSKQEIKDDLRDTTNEIVSDVKADPELDKITFADLFGGGPDDQRTKEQQQKVSDEVAGIWSNIAIKAAGKFDDDRPLSGIFSSVVGSVVDVWLPGVGQLVEKALNRLTMDTDDFVADTQEKLNNAFADTDFLTNMFKNFAAWEDMSHDAFVEIAEGLSESLTAALPDIIVGFADAFADGDLALRIVIAIVKGFVKGFDKMLSRSYDLFVGAIEHYIDRSDENLAQFSKNLAYAFGGIQDEIEQAQIELAEDIASGVSEALESAFKEVFTESTKAIKESAVFLVDAIKDGLTKQIPDMLKGIRDALKDALKIELKIELPELPDGISATEVFKFHSGGLVGAPIQKFANGGTVDDVPAMLQAGEFVINREATKNNLGLLQNINAGGGGGGGMTINLTVNGGLLGNEADARKLARAIDENLMKLRQSNESLSFDSGIF